jgi:hypothetical protein
VAWLVGWLADDTCCGLLHTADASDEHLQRRRGDEDQSGRREPRHGQAGGEAGRLVQDQLLTVRALWVPACVVALPFVGLLFAASFLTLVLGVLLVFLCVASRHICLANDDSYLGKETNPWAIRSVACRCVNVQLQAWVSALLNRLPLALLNP